MTEHTPWSEIKHKSVKKPSTVLLECGHRKSVTSLKLTLSAATRKDHMLLFCSTCDCWRELTEED